MSDVNVFILINLGCEMLYVIDQRLRAQNIALDKSVQVLRDITGVLLDSTFIERLIIGSKHKAILTEEHCKFILNDFACCSLMRLDESSMSKLWDLITMVFKWQIEMAHEPEQLLWITNRHLDGVSQLHPSAKKATLVDTTKITIANFWNSHNKEKQNEIFHLVKCWFKPFTTKISIFIRLGFQNIDGSFNEQLKSDLFMQFVNNIGENIYQRNEGLCNTPQDLTTNQFKGLAEQLNVAAHNDAEVFPTTADLLFKSNEKGTNEAEQSETSEFVQLKPKHNATSTWESLFSERSASSGKKNLQTLLTSKHLQNTL